MSTDLAMANQRYQNIRGVKEATEDLDNMRFIRKLCGKDFSISSGDKTLRMMLDLDIVFMSNLCSL